MKGCDVAGTNTSSFAAARAIAKEADVVVFVGGLNTSIEGEARDRVDIDLPQIQQDLIRNLTDVNPNVVLVLIHGGIVAIDNIINSVASVISVGYPGRYTGHVLPEALFGLNERAWGKLPVTWYKNDMTTELDMEDFDMSRPPGRTYRYYSGEPQFEFGFGLNPLTTFRLENLRLEESSTGINPSPQATVTVTLHNSGGTAGDEVILAYIIPEDVPVSEPASKVKKQLFGFQRIHLMADQRQNVTFTVGSADFKFFDDDGLPVQYAGLYRIRISTGTSSVEHSIRLEDADGAISMSLLEAERVGR